MYSRKSVGPRMGSLGTPALTRAVKSRFSGALKSVLLEASSEEHHAPLNFLLPMTLLNIEMNIKTNSDTAVSSVFFFF